MEALLSFSATILVAIIGLIGIIIQSRTNTKIKKQSDIVDEINEMISEIKNDYMNESRMLNNRIDALSLESCKRFLVTELTKIKKGYCKPTDEEIMILYETKKIYNLKGGNSYVNDLFEELKENGLI